MIRTCAAQAYDELMAEKTTTAAERKAADIAIDYVNRLPRSMRTSDEFWRIFYANFSFDAEEEEDATEAERLLDYVLGERYHL